MTNGVRYYKNINKMKISNKANRYAKMFEVKTLDHVTQHEGQPKNKVVLNSKATNPLYEAIRSAHGDMLPNDFIYETFCDLLEQIADYEIDTIDKLEGLRSEIVDSQVDIYTHNQKQWLIDYPKADDFMSEAIASRSYSTDDGMWQVYSYAQYLAVDEIMQEVINLLSN